MPRSTSYEYASVLCFEETLGGNGVNVICGDLVVVVVVGEGGDILGAQMCPLMGFYGTFFFSFGARMGGKLSGGQTDIRSSGNLK